ncbi:MAG TPA: RseA family anti-sigma factor [Casimicrobiaceae bacterium]|nr:RseA family anti-sigma factor [Casimicrobiaceae bacterium]
MNEQLSRLMDGDLPDADIERVVRGCGTPDAIVSWTCYHLIGDTLRGDASATVVVRRATRERLVQALASEPTVLAPKPRRYEPVVTWGWAAAATVAAIAVVGWTAVSLTDSPGTVVAKAREARALTAAQVRPQALPPDYVLVHQEYSPATAIQGVRPYLRAVSAP